ncbi:MAG: hypothetical protein AAF702_06090 [Chloroflexota bacterium]
MTLLEQNDANETVRNRNNFALCLLNGIGIRLLIILMSLSILCGAGSTGFTAPAAMAQQDSNNNESSENASTSGTVEQDSSTNSTSDNVRIRRVKANFYINSIHSIDDARGTYAIDFWLDLFWNDPALGGNTVDEVDPSLFWNPKIHALNSNDLVVLFQSYSDSFEPDTNIYFSQRLVGTFQSEFDLSRFPFDSQLLMIQIESQEFDSNRLLFDFLGSDQEIIYSERPFRFPIPMGKYISPEFELPGWSITSSNVIQQIHVLPYDKSSWAQFRIEIQIKRIWRSFVLKMMLVFALIMLLGTAVFTINVGDSRYRLLALFTLLLTAITFDFTRLQHSPLVTTITLLDLQALLSYVVLSLAISAVVAIGILNRQGVSATQRLNMGMAIGYGTLVLLINIGLFWYGAGG